MAFDDEKEDFISYFDTTLVHFCLTLVAYVIWQHSVHFWAFLSATRGSGRRMRLIVEQFTSDLLSVVALSVRFFILLFRINVYDMLDDCFDSYYIFVGDFAENTYVGEALVRVGSESVSTFVDNQSDWALTNDTALETGRDLYVNLALTYFKVMSWLVSTGSGVPQRARSASAGAALDRKSRARPDGSPADDLNMLRALPSPRGSQKICLC
jgi:hypothetical protein